MKIEAHARLTATDTSKPEHPAGENLTQANLVAWIRSVVQKELGSEVKSPPLLRRQKSNLGSLILPTAKPKGLAKLLVQYGYKHSGHGVTLLKTVDGKHCVVVADPTDDGRGSAIYVKVA